LRLDDLLEAISTVRRRIAEVSPQSANHRGEAQALQPFERAAIWHQTPQGEDWNCGDDESRESYPVCDADIVACIISDYVNSSLTSCASFR
jgi:hypothetical protein